MVPLVAAALSSPMTVSPGWNSRLVEKPLQCIQKSVKEQDKKPRTWSQIHTSFSGKAPTCKGRYCTSPRRVFSILPFTSLAKSASSSTSKWAVIIGVLNGERQTFNSIFKANLWCIHQCELILLNALIHCLKHGLDDKHYICMEKTVNPCDLHNSHPEW